MLFALFYTATYSPYRVAFYSDTTDFLLVFETGIDILFIMDLIITFLTPFERKDGSYESRPKKIASNYICGAFFIDFFASIPT